MAQIRKMHDRKRKKNKKNEKKEDLSQRREGAEEERTCFVSFCFHLK